MAFLRDLWDISIPGQRINAARAQRAQMEAQRAAAQQQAAAFDALRSGNVMGAAALDPEAAAKYQQVAAGQQEQSAAQSNLRAAAISRAARAAQALSAKSGDPVAAYDFVVSKAPGLFGSPEDLAAGRALVEQYGDEGLNAIVSSLSEPKSRYLSVGGNVFDQQSGQFLDMPDSPEKALDLEYKRAQIDAQRALAAQRAAGGGPSASNRLNEIKLAEKEKEIAQSAAREEALANGAFYLDLSKGDQAKFGLNIRSAIAADNEIDDLIAKGASFSDSLQDKAATAVGMALPGDLSKFAQRALGSDKRDMLVNAAARYEETITPIKAGLAATAGEADRIVRAGLPVPGDSAATLAAKSRHRKLLLDTAKRALAGQPIYAEDQATVAQSAASIGLGGAANQQPVAPDERLSGYTDEELEAIAAGMQ